MDYQLDKILKYLLILVLMINVIVLLVPWGETEESAVGKLYFYNWGTQINSLNGENKFSFNVFFINSEHVDDFFNIDNNNFGFIPILFGILALFFHVLVIVLTAGFIIKNEYYKKDIAFNTVYSILALISFYIFIQFGVLSLSISPYVTFNYSTGFYLLIFSIIILVLAYFLLDYFSKEKIEKKTEEKIEKKNGDNTHLEILKTRYAKGEITKEEFDKIKKDIEDF